MGFMKPKIKPTTPPPAPVEPAEVDAPDAEAVDNALTRAKGEASRKGKSKLRIPLGGTTGGSGISIPTM
jgi:hypothetical protein